MILETPADNGHVEYSCKVHHGHNGVLNSVHENVAEHEMTTFPPNDFRTKREYLPDKAFGLISTRSGPSLDRNNEQKWTALVSLPDHVVLRTTSFQDPMATVSKPGLH